MLSDTRTDGDGGGCRGREGWRRETRVRYGQRLSIELTHGGPSKGFKERERKEGREDGRTRTTSVSGCPTARRGLPTAATTPTRTRTTTALAPIRRSLCPLSHRCQTHPSTPRPWTVLSSSDPPPASHLRSHAHQPYPQPSQTRRPCRSPRPARRPAPSLFASPPAPHRTTRPEGRARPPSTLRQTSASYIHPLRRHAPGGEQTESSASGARDHGKHAKPHPAALFPCVPVPEPPEETTAGATMSSYPRPCTPLRLTAAAAG